MAWHGDIFVVKKAANGDNVMDVELSDIKDILELIRESVVTCTCTRPLGFSETCSCRAVFSSRMY